MWWRENLLLLLGPVKQGPFPSEFLDVSLGGKPQKSKEACATQGLEIRRFLSQHEQEMSKILHKSPSFCTPHLDEIGVEGALQIGSPSSRIGAQSRTYFEL